jgi:hypothetical protein
MELSLVREKSKYKWKQLPLHISMDSVELVK